MNSLVFTFCYDKQHCNEYSWAHLTVHNMRISLAYISRCETTRSEYEHLQIYWIFPNCSPKWLCKFILPPAVYKSSHFLPTSSLKLGIIRPFNLSGDFSVHFNLCFSDCWWGWDSSCVCAGPWVDVSIESDNIVVKTRGTGARLLGTKSAPLLNCKWHPACHLTLSVPVSSPVKGVW